MPHSALHQEKKAKNRATLFALLAIIVVLFIATMIKVTTQS
jgi:hypothetical protein